ncbi:MAG: hypothetical protein HC822_19725 [Oscillochloris sp.]|nr:hypothetical protein [Oscillochloris sp.]
MRTVTLFTHLLALSALILGGLIVLPVRISQAQNGAIIYVAPDGSGAGSSWNDPADLQDALSDGAP